MKKAIWKSFLFVFLIPLGIALLFTTLYCFFSNMYYEWFWVSEWMVSLPEVIAYYVVHASVYASFGVVAYFVFFNKTGRAILLSAVFAVTAFIFPFLRYLVRHIFFASTANVADMLDIFATDMETSLYLIISYAIGLFIIWLEKAFYRWILKEKPQMVVASRTFSPKNPVGLAMLIYFAALAVLSVILFTISGEYSGENILSLGLEFVIDIAGFFIAVSGAILMAKLAKTAQMDTAVE